jgi:hemerythrin-like domain-containing protein
LGRLVRAILKEHRLIERVLDRMEQTLSRLGRDRGVPLALQALFDFLKYFAEYHHHQREETEFFPLLRRSGLHEIARMLAEDHRTGLAQLEAMERCLTGVARGEKRAIKFLRHEGGDYISLLRERMRQEDDILHRLEAERHPKSGFGGI